MNENKKLINLEAPIQDECFSCEICYKSFSLLGNLNRHRRIHLGGKPYFCKICKKAFSELVYAQRHMTVHKSNRPFECMVCSKTFKEKSHLRRHQIAHKDDCPFVCEICGKPSSNAYSHRLHTMTHTDEKPFNCEECDKTFRTKGNLQEHKQVHSAPNEKEAFDCDACVETFTSIQELRSHYSVHSDKVLFTCDFCHKTFFSTEEIRDHYQSMHSNERLHMCDECCQTFRLKKQLKQHYKYIHSSSYECKTCHKCFQSDEALSLHSVSHSDMFMCDECGKKYISKRTLEIHKKNHNKKEITCEECGRQFKKMPDLEMHRWIHVDPKKVTFISSLSTLGKSSPLSKILPYSVPKDLPKPDSDITSLLISQPKDPFKCIVCYKSFKNEVQLKQHQCKHFNRDQKFIASKFLPLLLPKITPLSCLKEVPKKKVVSKRTRTKKHSKIKYECLVCCRNFKCKSELDMHSWLHVNPDNVTFGTGGWGVTFLGSVPVQNGETDENNFTDEEEMIADKDLSHEHIISSKPPVLLKDKISSL